MPKAPKALYYATVVFAVAFALLAATTGYWSLVARDSLIARPDNPRALIAFNRIERGDILDRNGLPLAETIGEPGDYTRRTDVAAAHVVGYASFRYGFSGVEAAADSVLSGVDSQDNVESWWRHDILGEPQIGRDVQLTLDLTWQRAAFNTLANRPGAIVVVEAATGDIVAMASAPSFDPAQLDADFEAFNTETQGPLINRATGALYPADGVIALFPSPLDLPSPIELPIPVRPADGRKVSPLQIALLTAALGNNGEMPAPRLIAAICGAGESECTPAPPLGHPIAIIPPDIAERLRARMNFKTTEPAGFDNRTVGWFIGLSADGTKAICILLENSTGEEAAKAGADLLLPSPAP